MHNFDIARELHVADADVRQVTNFEDGGMAVLLADGRWFLRDTDGNWTFADSLEVKQPEPNTADDEEADTDVDEADEADEDDDADEADEADEGAGVPDPADDEVPTGSNAVVLSWVGDDAERARRALEQENAKSSPRKGLVSELEKRAGE